MQKQAKKTCLLGSEKSQVTGKYVSSEIKKEKKGREVFDDDSDEELALIEEEDEQERSFNLLGSLTDKNQTEQVSFQNSQKKSHPVPALQKQLIQPLEMMYLIFSSYQPLLQKISNEYSCRIKITINRLKILSYNPENLQIKQLQAIFQKCEKDIIREINNIVYMECTIRKIFHIYDSYHFHEQAKEAKFKITKFDHKIYFHTNQLSYQQLKNISRDVIHKKIVFTLYFKNPKQRTLALDDNVAGFISKVIKHNEKQFIQRETIVQISRNKYFIHCIGYRERDVLAAKNIMKNVIESMSIILIKNYQNLEMDDTEIKQKQIKAYLKKISNYPIYNGVVQGKTIIISKDNILKSLFKKDKFRQLLKANPKTQISIYLSRLQSYTQKKDLLHQICYEKGFDLPTLGGIYHIFRKIFVQQNQDVSIDETFDILCECLQGLCEQKQKWEIPSNYRFMEKRQKKINGDGEDLDVEYIQTGEITEEEYLSDVMRRNVMLEKLRMGKHFLIKYKVFEGEVINNVYWCKSSEKDKIRVCTAEQIRESYEKNSKKLPCEYFMGKIKRSELGIVYFYEGRIQVL